MTTRILAAFALTMICSAVMGQTLDDFIATEQNVIASDGGIADHFGFGVSISGDLMVIGARDANGDIANSGVAYIFERDAKDAWSETAKLTPSDGVQHDYFGESVSISGEMVVVGSPYATGNGSDSGSAYVFERDAKGAWSETAILAPSDGAFADHFGFSVSISGDLVVVGAYDDDSAYIFERDAKGSWAEVQKLTASEGGGGRYFGASVSISGDRVVVGAYRDNVGPHLRAGSAYIFERDGAGSWTEVQKLTASDRAEYDFFGSSVSISGEAVVIGAPNDELWRNNIVSGSAYIFERDGAGSWTEVQKLTASDGGGGDYFGYSVSISGERLVVGAYLDDDNGSNSGSAYIFERDGNGAWPETTKLTASDGAGHDYFGWSVSISGETVVIGARNDDESTLDAGSAYIFDLFNVLNLDYDWERYSSLAAALEEALPTDRLAVRSSAFAVDGILNTSSMPLTFIAVEPIEIGAGLMFLPADGTSFTDSGDVEEAGYSLYAQLIAPEQGQLVFSSLELLSGSQFHHNESSLMVNRDLVTTGGVGYLSGDILSAEASTGIDGANRVAGDTNMFCDYTNDGATIIQRGILYIYGDLVNNGTLTGEYNNGFNGGGEPEPGDGFSVGGSYTIGQAATLSMPDPVWWLRVGGDLDIAIDDPSNFTMLEATIELNGLAPGKSQTLEALSADLGAVEAGFDPSNFPIGTLRITSDSTTQLVNNHVNSVEAECEVLYVNELFVAPGGSLLTGGCTIYAHSATIDGTVDDPEAIVIVEGTPPCPADLTGDGEVSGADLGLMIAFWGTPGGDLTGDGTTDGADLGMLIAAWGACPR